MKNLYNLFKCALLLSALAAIVVIIIYLLYQFGSAWMCSVAGDPISTEMCIDKMEVGDFFMKPFL
jgi:hypothetical protein